MSWSRILGPVLVLAVALPALAQGTPQLRIDIEVAKEIARVDPAGNVQVQHLPVQEAVVGDVLVYSLAIVNEGAGPAVNANVVDPVPENTVLIPDSAIGDGTRISYSIDGGRTYGSYPITRLVPQDDGREQEIPVPAEAYTHVRWTLTESLAPGQVRTANFKVRVR